MGYGWPGRLRPPPTPFIPGLPRHPHLLRRRLAGFAGQRAREGRQMLTCFRARNNMLIHHVCLVDLRSTALLPRPSNHLGGLQEGLEV